MTHPLLGAVRPVAEALGARVVGAGELEASDIPLVWEGQTVGGVRLVAVHDALALHVASVERELGAPLPQLSRKDKQRAVRLLERRGAFKLRKSVEEVAELLGVSRFTVYNYINRPLGGEA